MKVLVLPDVHGRKFWRKAVDNNIGQVDKVIFLGDYLDPYQNEIEEDSDSMECNDFEDCQGLLNMLNDIISLKKSEPNKYILLTGNHTDSYIWSNFQAATRTDKRNWKKYNKFFSENLNLFNLAWIEGNCIFSHAGISEGWAYEFLANYMKYDESALDGISFVKECAEVLRDTNLVDFNNHYINAISNISSYRGGWNNYGSCEWADIREHISKVVSPQNNEFIGKGEEGVFQVFGHTQLKAPLVCDKWLCLDCRKGFIFDTNTHDCVSCL